jgi:hypothetical protein
LYRLTFKRGDGRTWELEVVAANFPASLQCRTDIFYLIRIERINRITGNVVSGTYKE